MAESNSDELAAKRADFLSAIGIGRLSASESIKVRGEVIGRFNGGGGCRFIPGFGNRYPAFITITAVIGWERGGHHEGRRRVRGREIARRDRLLAPVRRSPQQRDGRLLF